MTNAEKYLKDGVSTGEFVSKLEKYYSNYNDEKGYQGVQDLNEYIVIEFLNEQVQPTLTEDERVILKHIDKQFYYIKRISGELQLTNKEHTWCDYELLVDDGVFQFIKERRRI